MAGFNPITEGNSLALGSLKSSADGGFMQPARLESDTEWNSLRSNDQFIALAKQVQHNANPCEDSEFKQFDFWLGDWDVASAADGTRRGSSHISKEMNGCVVWENWTSAGSPYFGKKLQYLESKPQTMGTVLGGHLRRRHVLPWQFERQYHGLLDR
jgi:hypothetical protein